MNKSIKSKLCIFLAASTALSLVACSTETPESDFDNPLPWHDNASTGSYEKLDYAVKIYDTTTSTAEDARTQIADGTLTYTLTESLSDYSTYITVNMSMSVTYFQDAPAPDAGLTDTITSTVEFASNSLAVRRMEKTVDLADRADTANLSYNVTANYFNEHDEHVATFHYTKQENAEEQTMALPTDVCRDNEMMFYCARAQAIGNNSSTNFKMVNLFDSFNNNKLTEYRISVSGGETHTMNIGDWVKDYGVEAVTDEQTGEVSYPVSCTYTSMIINDEKHGPPYVVLYSDKAFTSGGYSHKKIPVRIEYSQYTGNSPYRHTEYTLTACDFQKK
ncbi:MAG: hypothetical protein HDT28_07340 [Clostridiales bacterium]|nr:hypothetical protein [Clostridiales bacterium]